MTGSGFSFRLRLSLLSLIEESEGLDEEASLLEASSSSRRLLSRVLLFSSQDSVHAID